MTNWFAHADAAERYVRGRVPFHPAVVARIAERIGRPRVADALDVCCGTGMSTVALKEIADRVVGLDASAEMLALAPRAPGIDYVESPAETLPFPASSFDLVSVACGFHWLDRERFLAEARRVLRPGGWLAVYGHGFVGELADEPGFTRWHDGPYLARYPLVPRRGEPITPEEAFNAGFAQPVEALFDYTHPFTRDRFVDYLASRSNITAAVESGRERMDEATDWLRNELTPWFGGGNNERRFRFKTWLRMLKVPSEAMNG